MDQALYVSRKERNGAIEIMGVQDKVRKGRQRKQKQGGGRGRER